MNTNSVSSPARRARQASKVPAPLPLAGLAVGLLMNYVPGLLPQGLVSGLSYVGWMAPLLASAFYLFISRRSIAFPWAIWMPWMLWVIYYLLTSDAENVLQRSIMLLTPVVVGCSFSVVRPTDDLLDKCAHWMRVFLWVFLAAAAVSTGLASGELYAATGFAAGSITASMLASWYAARFALSRNRYDLIIWVALSAVPILANTRTGMIATAVTLPLVLAPWPVTRRLLTVLAIAVCGALVFQSDRIQSKMFYSGSGTVSDALQGITGLFTDESEGPTDFATSGRFAMSQALRADIPNAYWLGHGANTTEEISMAITGVAHPHNDWLRLQYEYGTLGMALFALTMALQALHAIIIAARLPLTYRLYLYAGATAFIPMSIFMFSDNIILYVAWFGNLQFALLGMGYAVARAVAAQTGSRQAHAHPPRP